MVYNYLEKNNGSVNYYANNTSVETDSSTIAALATKAEELFSMVSNEGLDNLDLTSIAKKALKELQDELDSQNASKDEIIKSVKKLADEIISLKEDVERLSEELLQKREELKAQQEYILADQNAYEETKRTIESKQKDYEYVTNSIEKAMENLEEDAKRAQKRAVYKALAEYNKDKDGDFDAYLAKKLKGAVPSQTYQTLIKSLSGQSHSLLNEIGNLQTNLSELESALKSCQENISSIKDSITDLSSQITAKNSEIDEKQAEIKSTVSGLVSKEEWSIVEESGIDLKETLKDGSARYVFAKGKKDNKYHVFDTQTGKSVVRTYAKNGGYDIIEQNNGMMYCYKEGKNINEKEKEEILSLTDCGLNSKTASYITCSPLSFDLNGDGVKTSDRVITYDIDGDGVLDKINDSNDGVLVFDKDGDGVSGSDGSECFGNNTDLDGDGVKDGFKNGFEALLALGKKEGLIDEKDDMTLSADDLAILEEKHGLKMKKGYNAQAQSLSSFGITEINLSKSAVMISKNFDNANNDLMTQEGATFTINGKTREYADIWHAKKEGETYSATDFCSQIPTNPFEGIADYEFISTENKNLKRSIYKLRQEANEVLEKANQKIRKYYIR